MAHRLPKRFPRSSFRAGEITPPDLPSTRGEELSPAAGGNRATPTHVPAAPGDGSTPQRGAHRGRYRIGRNGRSVAAAACGLVVGGVAGMRWDHGEGIGRPSPPAGAQVPCPAPGRTYATSRKIPTPVSSPVGSGTVPRRSRYVGWSGSTCVTEGEEWDGSSREDMRGQGAYGLARSGAR